MDKTSFSHNLYGLANKGMAFAALENLQELLKSKNKNKKLSDLDKCKKKEDDFTQTNVESASVIIIVSLHKEN